MRRLVIFSMLMFLALAGYTQQKPVHPVDLYECIGKNSKWVDRYVRSQYGTKPEKEKAGQDTVRLSFYNTASDVRVAAFIVNDVCEYIGFSDYSLNENNLNTYFSRWCSDVTDYYTLVSGTEERYPMYEDTSLNMVFFIPEKQPENNGMQYYMFSGFIRGERILSMN